MRLCKKVYFEYILPLLHPGTTHILSLQHGMNIMLTLIQFFTSYLLHHILNGFQNTHLNIKQIQKCKEEDVRKRVERKVFVTLNIYYGYAFRWDEIGLH